jgi:hypothetical protein
VFFHGNCLPTGGEAAVDEEMRVSAVRPGLFPMIQPGAEPDPRGTGQGDVPPSGSGVGRPGSRSCLFRPQRSPVT